MILALVVFAVTFVIAYSIISLGGISIYYYIKKYRLVELNLASIPIKGVFGEILLNEKVSDYKNYYRVLYKY